jgi:hypothetical protein
LIAVRGQRQALDDRRQDADLGKIFRPRILLVTALLAEGGDQVLVVGEAFQQPDVPVDPHLQRQHAAWKEDGRHERNDRQPGGNVDFNPLGGVVRMGRFTAVCLCHESLESAASRLY